MSAAPDRGPAQDGLAAVLARVRADVLVLRLLGAPAEKEMGEKLSDDLEHFVRHGMVQEVQARVVDGDGRLLAGLRWAVAPAGGGAGEDDAGGVPLPRATGSLHGRVVYAPARDRLSDADREALSGELRLLWRDSAAVADAGGRWGEVDRVYASAVLCLKRSVWIPDGA